MSETTGQYVARITSLVEDSDVLSVLEATPAKLSSLLAGKSAAAVSTRPAADRWSPAEIVIHLSEVELMVGCRIRLILGANGTPIQAFDQNVWATRYADQPYEPALELFSAVRAANLALLKSLTREQWQQYGMHAERGKETLERVARMNAGHDLNHLQQISDILG